MVYDAQHAFEHPEVAAWALGALDPGDAASFEEHLRSCEQCREQAAQFAPVARSLPLAVPAAEPPPDLEHKVLAAVRYAVMTESHRQPEPELERRPEPVAPGPASKASRWWHLHWTNPLLSVVTALGAAAVTAAVFVGVHIFQPTAPAAAASFNLRPQPGQTGSATATARDTAGGYEILLTAKNLPKLGSGQFFECWYAGPDNRPGHKELISGGTFASSNGSFTMWTAADPDTFKVMQITEEQAGKGSQQGKIILSGTTQNVHDYS
ncbi:MAG: anti-sigma factor domain-containing protein [Streptosporangiaceae bacterium]